MDIIELKDEIKIQQQAHINNVMRCLLADPFASDYLKKYENTEQYLHELIEKDGSVLSGIISAMEIYLKK